MREGGLGVVIEYANQRKTPQWVAPPKSSWDYTIFGKSALATRSDRKHWT